MTGVDDTSYKDTPTHPLSSVDIRCTSWSCGTADDGSGIIIITLIVALVLREPL